MTWLERDEEINESVQLCNIQTTDTESNKTVRKSRALDIYYLHF